jgi:FkbM family methyltransferase
MMIVEARDSAISGSRFEALERANADALRYRDEKEVENARFFQAVPISRLIKMPAYTGFINCNFIKDISFVFFLCENDDGVALRLFWKREFEPLSLLIWNYLVKRSTVAIDVGGHTGVYTIVAALSNSRASVYTFEPHVLNFSRLLINLRANGLPITHLHNIALADKDETVPFQVSFGSYLSSGGKVVSEENKYTKTVHCRALDDVVTLKDSDKACIKIDTEGHELKVLAGMKRTFGVRPDIILECKVNESMRDVEIYLRDLGYHFYVIDDGHFTIAEIDKLSDGSDEIKRLGRNNILLTTAKIDSLPDFLKLMKNNYNNSI